MKIFFTIFRKEFTDMIRDRRTIFFMIVFPLVFMPLIMTAVTKLQTSSMKKAEHKTLRVAVVANGNAALLVSDLTGRKDLHLLDNIPADSLEALIARDSLDAAVLIAKDFDNTVAQLQSGRIQLYYKSSQDYDAVKRRMTEILDKYKKTLVAARFANLKLDQEIVNPVQLDEHDVASMQEKIGKTVGGMIPYLFVLFCFMGSMYPAIDLAAGEKERGTMETLLTAPVGRFQILLGKFAVVVLSGLLSAAVSVIGIFIAIQQFQEISSQAMTAIMSILAVGTVILVLLMLLPLAMFFAAALLSLSMYAKSYKEAQSIISPLSILIILPILLGVMPGIALTPLTALIPVLNVSLATKEIIAGTAKPLLLVEVYGTLILLAALSLAGCAKWFMREETLFRGV
jgi:sodium transport system permease protein